MDVAGITSAVSSLNTARILGQVQVAVAAKMLKTANDTGEAVVSLIESAAESMEQAMAQAPGAVGSNLDLVG